MRNVFRVMVALLIFAACSEGGEPPEVCQTHAEQSIKPGESVDLVMCFVDPNALSMTYSATSSDLMVITAEMSAEVLTIEAIAPGSATVTVTARNAEGLATNAEVAVLVPNEPPVTAKRKLPPIYLRNGDNTTKTLSGYATDPDGSELTFTAVSADASVMTAIVSGAELTLTGISVGSTTVTVTATDNAGGELDMTVPAEVYTGEDWLVVDQFDRMGDWNLGYNSDVKLDNSELEIWGIEPLSIGHVIAWQRIGGDWSVEALVAQLDDQGLPGLTLRINVQNENYRYPWLIFQVGEDEDADGKTYQLLLFDKREGTWIIIQDGTGDDVEVEVDEYIQIGMGRTDGEFWVAVGEHRLTPTMPNGIRWGKIDGVALSSWPVMIEELAGRITVDWIRIKATETGQSKVRHEPLSLPGRIGRVR